jgi:hypothetical protein
MTSFADKVAGGALQTGTAHAKRQSAAKSLSFFIVSLAGTIVADEYYETVKK